jgi:membrane protein
MSSTHSNRDLRGRPLALPALIYACVLGLAASIIHGAFGRGPVTAPKAAPDRRDMVSPSRQQDGVQREGVTSRAGAAPTDIAPRGWWQVLKSTVSEVSSDRVMTVAGGVTFYGLLSLFPALTVLVSLYGIFAEPQSISEHLKMLGSFLPESAMSVIGEQATRIASGDQARLSIAGLTGGLIALWSANAAMKALIDTLNIVYDAEEARGFFKLNAVTLLFTISAIVGVMVLFVAVAAVPVIMNFLRLGGVLDFVIWAGRWPVIFVLVVLALAVLYRFGPCRPNVRWRWITPGSFVAALGLLIISMLFSWYAANFGKFNETYGSLGAVIGFMTWMWLSATMVLVGAELNAEIENHARPGAAEDAPPADQPAASRSKR